MLDQFRALGLYSLAEQNYLRLEAKDLFARCLTEGSPDYLLQFIEQQILAEPPRIDLLQEVAEDLHQRLLSLREYHFAVRDRVLRTLRSDFSVDLTPIVPPDALATYHRLNLDDALSFIARLNPAISSRDRVVLRELLEASVEMAAQLYEDVAMTEELFFNVMDWADGLSVVIGRCYRLYEWDAHVSERIH